MLTIFVSYGIISSRSGRRSGQPRLATPSTFSVGCDMPLGKSILWTAILLLTPLGCVNPDLPDHLPEYRLSLNDRQRLLDDCVHICTESGQGSGLRLYDRLVLTANHVIEGDLDIKINDIPYQVYRQDKEADLALLVESGYSMEWGDRRWRGVPSSIEMGEEVWVAGFPLGQGPYLTSGYISEHENDAVCGILVSTNAIFGSSGSGVVDADGKLVGVIQRIFTDRQGTPVISMLIMSKCKSLRFFLRGIR